MTSTVPTGMSSTATLVHVRRLFSSAGFFPPAAFFGLLAAIGGLGRGGTVLRSLVRCTGELARGMPKRTRSPERRASANQAHEHDGQLLAFVLLHPFQSRLDLAAGNVNRRRLEMEPVDIQLHVVLVMFTQPNSWGMSAAGGTGASAAVGRAAWPWAGPAWPPWATAWRSPGAILARRRAGRRFRKQSFDRPAGTHGPSLPRRTRCSGLSCPLATMVLSC